MISEYSLMAIQVLAQDAWPLALNFVDDETGPAPNMHAKEPPLNKLIALARQAETLEELSELLDQRSGGLAKALHGLAQADNDGNVMCRHGDMLGPFSWQMFTYSELGWPITRAKIQVRRQKLLTVSKQPHYVDALEATLDIAGITEVKAHAPYGSREVDLLRRLIAPRVRQQEIFWALGGLVPAALDFDRAAKSKAA